MGSPVPFPDDDSSASSAAAADAAGGPPPLGPDFDAATFLAAASELGASPQSDAALSRFLRSFSVPTVVAALSWPHDAAVRLAALDALGCIVRSEAAGNLLRGFLPLLGQGLCSPSADVAQLCCLTVQRIADSTVAAAQRTEEWPHATYRPTPPGGTAIEAAVEASGAAAEASTAAARADRSAKMDLADDLLGREDVLVALIACLANNETSAATSAADATVALCRLVKENPQRLFTRPVFESFANLLRHPSALVRQRALGLSARLASVSDTAAKIVEHSGALDVLLAMLAGGVEGGAAVAAAATTPATAQSAAAATAAAAAGSVGPLDALAALTAWELLVEFVMSASAARLVSRKPQIYGVLVRVLEHGWGGGGANVGDPAAVTTATMMMRAAWRTTARLVSPAWGVASPLSHQQVEDIGVHLDSLCKALQVAAARERGGGGGGGADSMLVDSVGPSSAASSPPSFADEGVERVLRIADPGSGEETMYEAVAILSSSARGASLLLRCGSNEVMQPSSSGRPAASSGLATVAAVAAGGPSRVVLQTAKAAFRKVLFPRASFDLQVAAIHGLASVFGAERGEAAGEASATSAMTSAHLPSGDPVSEVVQLALSSPSVLQVPVESVELEEVQERRLREAVEAAAAGAPGGPTVGGALLSLLKQTEEVRVAAYRLISSFVERPWGLVELCSTPELVDRLADPAYETQKAAMDWRHTCCVAAATAAKALMVRASGAGVAGLREDMVGKLDAASRLGPYLIQRRIEARPIVITDERPPTGI